MICHRLLLADKRLVPAGPKRPFQISEVHGSSLLWAVLGYFNEVPSKPAGAQ